MTWHTSDKMLELRDKSRPLDVTVEMLDGWRRHLSGRNAWFIAFFGFLSIFPLALAATTVLGLVLDGNEDLQQRVAEGAFDDIPLIGDNLTSNPDPGGSIWVLLLGLGGALWSSTKAFVAIHGAQDDTWEVHVDDRSKTPKVRAMAFLGIIILGGAQIGSMVLASIVSPADLPGIGDVFKSRILVENGLLKIHAHGARHLIDQSRMFSECVWAEHGLSRFRLVTKTR